MSPSKVSFERITQLPTPVLPSGSFSYNYVYPSPQEQGFRPIESLSKRSPRHLKSDSREDLPDLHRHHQSPERVISDYKPIPALGRKNSLLENSVTNTKKRFVSNPVQFRSSKSSGTSSPLTPPSISASSSTTSPGSPQTSPKKLLHPVSEKAVFHLSKYANQLFVSNRLGQTFQFVDEIGTGNFSTVILARSPVESVAIKIITIPMKYGNEISNFKSFIKRELNILHQLDHPCIIKLIDYDINLSIDRKEIESELVLDSETEIYPEKDYETSPIEGNENSEYRNLQLNSDQLIFLNYCAGGNFYQLLHDHKQTTDLNYWIAIRRIICELVVAVAYLHSRNIIHRDIKLENVLLKYDYETLLQLASHTEESLINLTDFGLSKKLKRDDQLLSTRCGSQDYIPPELLMGLKYNGKLTDSWSIGVLIYAVLEDRLPFDLPPLAVLQNSGVSPAVIRRKLSKQNSAHRIAMIDWDWFKVNEHLASLELGTESKQILQDLKKVVDLLLVRKDKRITVEQLLHKEEFAWIRNCLPTSFMAGI
ncbi:kinase-like protein [Suhomyces tanzawaensis NRRL Y-17324]|uniref:Kinase-like protein n=1 Tax=Suhomyces tanzawaensis NRRL Y-17324 TaxID=984487 RepID=A0A1E4SHC4_9ASCO|nr:kinase-like protein [Suhomyces tanzawaensis NRRL Y-17324]ODV78822.1 kinase-like protein [Suhomyces tanzawaensis NRRL Y-17324]